MQNLDKTMIDKLIGTAIEQLKFSYAPYSNFKVGAALLAKNGEIYTGCNIEMQHTHLLTALRELRSLRL